MSLEKVREILSTLTQLRTDFDKVLLRLAEVVPEIRDTVLARIYAPVDLEDAGDAYILRMDLPGFDPSEIRVRVSEDAVEVIAEVSEARRRELENRKYVIRERIVERVRRVIRLPHRVNPDGARARYSNGVLEVYLPKVSAVKRVELVVERQEGT